MTMRPIDADELMQLYENTPQVNIDNFSVPISVVRQNILDMPTISPYEWISVKDRLPEEDVRVLVYLDSDRSYTKIDTDRRFDGKWVRWATDVVYWMPLPAPPTAKPFTYEPVPCVSCNSYDKCVHTITTRPNDTIRCIHFGALRNYINKRLNKQ